MYPLWFLGTLFAAHMCLCKGVHGTDLRDCNITGELPAPQIFLNVSEAQEGDSVSLRCTLSSNFSVTTYFFCKDGEAKSAHKAMPHDAAYTWAFQISKQSAGQYSCGYKLKDNKNQEKKSALSAPWKLTLLPGNHNEYSGSNVLTLILPVVCLASLSLAALIYFSVKKVASQRSSREQAPVKNRSNLTSEENVQYANIVGLHQTGPPPFRNAETPYATIAPLKLHYEPAKEPSWNE